MKPVNLMALPAPDIIETLDFEQLVTAHKADLLQRYPTAANVLDLLSEPMVKQLEAFAYREMLLRERINQAARANLLAFASKADLDHKAAFYNLVRMPAENDERFRYRIQLRIASLAGNGTSEQYQLTAMSASSNVRDAVVYQIKPGALQLIVWLNDVSLKDATLAALNAAFAADDARPLCIPVTIVIAKPVAINLAATLWRLPEAPVDLVKKIAASLPAKIAAYARLGRSLPLSWITSVLHQEGIARVEYPASQNRLPQLFVLDDDEYAVSGDIALKDGGIA